jgi:hypothetical protein
MSSRGNRGMRNPSRFALREEGRRVKSKMSEK